jgi:histone H3/H4
VGKNNLKMSTRHLSTKQNFKGLQRKYHITQAETGCHDKLDQMQQAVLQKLVIQSNIQAEHSGRKRSLQKKDAVVAIDMTKEIPKGNY